MYKPFGNSQLRKSFCIDKIGKIFQLIFKALNVMILSEVGIKVSVSEWEMRK